MGSFCHSPSFLGVAHFQKNFILALPNATPESCPRDFGSQKLRDLGIEQPLGRLEGSRPSETQCCARLEPRRSARSPGLRPTAQSRQIVQLPVDPENFGVIKIWKIHRFPTNPLCQRDGGQCYGIGNQIRSRNNLYSEGGAGLVHKKRDKF